MLGARWYQQRIQRWPESSAIDDGVIGDVITWEERDEANSVYSIKLGDPGTNTKTRFNVKGQ